MDWDRIKRQLESIVNIPVQVVKLPMEEWRKRSGHTATTVPLVKSNLYKGGISFLLEVSGGAVVLLEMEEALLTATEKKLIELMLEAYRSQEKTKPALAFSEEQRKVNLVKDWFNQQLEKNHKDVELPDSLASQLSLYSTKIPLLLYGDYSDSRVVNYQDLKKLLESFFESDIILIPLMDKEWLILGTEALLSASGVEDKYGEENETIEESLSSICGGLYEMLSNEWVGECHLSIHYPMSPAKSLLWGILQMRESMLLGRAYYLGTNIHLPWMMHLEKLLNIINDEEKLRFVGQVFKRFDPSLDSEIQSTLECFFAMDCNVSETAKKLYIHRNTLLYRLDKIKQETGLDVRSFSHAVLVKVALLLYKVTKRK